ncbi:MAG: hypothetical protein ABEJ65_06585, partial [bacterium]
YVGLVASDERRDELAAAVADRLGVEQETVVEAVTTAAGLDIGAQTAEEIAVGYYLLLEEGAEEIDTFRMVVFGSPEPLTRFDPKLDPKRFEKQLIKYSVSDTPVPNVIYETVEDGFDTFFNSGAEFEELFNVIQSESEEELLETLSGLGDIVISQGDYELQTAANLLSRAEWEQRSSEDIRIPESASGEGDDQSTEKRLDVNIITSPTKGVPVDEVHEGLEIKTRITGEGVGYLPPDLVDNEKGDEVSVPLDSLITSMEEADQLPEGLEGDPSEYYELTVELQDGIYGKGLVFKGDRIKLANPPEEDEEPVDDELFVLILLVCLLLVVIVLFLLL